MTHFNPKDPPAELREEILTIVYAHVDLPSPEHETEANIAISELVKLFQAHQQQLLTELLGELPDKQKGQQLTEFDPTLEKLKHREQLGYNMGKADGFNTALDQVVSVIERKIGELNG